MKLKIAESVNDLSVKALQGDFKIKVIPIAGQQPKKFPDMLFESSGKEISVKYLNEQEGSSHYGNTPYRYIPKPSLKITPTEFVDLGQGLLDIAEEIHNDKS